MREYERTSTAVANAYVEPLIDSYLERMQTALVAEKFAGTIYLVTSGGGLTAIETARRFPCKWSIQDRPAAQFLRHKSRLVLARRGRSATTWVAQRPRSA